MDSHPFRVVLATQHRIIYSVMVFTILILNNLLAQTSEQTGRKRPDEMRHR